jgi:hypothetical protein
VAEVKEANKGSMAFEVMETCARSQIPHLDEIIHRAGDAATAVMIKDDAVDFLGVALKAMQQITCRDLPHPNGTVVRARNESVAVSGNGTYRIMVSR